MGRVAQSPCWIEAVVSSRGARGGREATRAPQGHTDRGKTGLGKGFETSRQGAGTEPHPERGS